jgi:ATP-dependent RNA helicase DHR2
MGKRKLEKDETCARGPPSKGTSRGNSSLKQQAFALLSDRKKLPIWQRLPEIEESLRSRDVLLLAGETGSGKSTQVPQCLLGEPWCKAQRVRVRRSDGAEEEVSVGGRIAVTEPRRVAAISLARRVAAERGTPLGNASPASEVGYAVRFERSVSPNARIVFLTEGVLLRELLRDPWLRQYSAVVVDEVHERGVDVDLVLGFLQRLLTGSLDGRGGVPLKVIIMSATADLVSLQRYFAQGYADARAETRSLAPASISEDDATHSDDEFSSWSGFSSSDNADDVDHKDEAVNLSSKISVCNVAGRQHPVDIQYLPQPAFDLMEAALRKIFEIHSGEALPGDILVFMAGQEDIEMLQHKIEDIAAQIPPSLPKVRLVV